MVHWGIRTERRKLAQVYQLHSISFVHKEMIQAQVPDSKTYQVLKQHIRKAMVS